MNWFGKKKTATASTTSQGSSSGGGGGTSLNPGATIIKLKESIQSQEKR
jgi:hypothetical protein